MKKVRVELPAVNPMTASVAGSIAGTLLMLGAGYLIKKEIDKRHKPSLYRVTNMPYQPWLNEMKHWLEEFPSPVEISFKESHKNGHKSAQQKLAETVSR